MIDGPGRAHRGVGSDVNHGQDAGDGTGAVGGDLRAVEAEAGFEGERDRASLDGFRPLGHGSLAGEERLGNGAEALGDFLGPAARPMDRMVSMSA